MNVKHELFRVRADEHSRLSQRRIKERLLAQLRQERLHLRLRQEIEALTVSVAHHVDEVGIPHRLPPFARNGEALLGIKRVLELAHKRVRPARRCLRNTLNNLL